MAALNAGFSVVGKGAGMSLWDGSQGNELKRYQHCFYLSEGILR